jgi:hypothetical protein
MPVTIQVNGTVNSLVHKMSNGISTATIPDVCKTPSPGGPVPIPYPNIAQSITLSDGTTTVKGDKMMAATKGSKFALSNGDQAGTIGGVKSNVFMKEATWILYSFDVKIDGKNACRFTDKMFHNSENAANLAGILQSVVRALGEDLAKEICAAICDAKDKGKQEDVAKHFSDPKGPQYTPKQGSNVWPEVPFKIPSRKGGLFQMLKSETGRKIGRLLAPASLKRWLNVASQLGKGRIVVWDLVIMDSFGSPKKFIEIKFPPDNWTKNQRKAATKIAKKDRGKIRCLTPKHCGC